MTVFLIYLLNSRFLFGTRSLALSLSQKSRENLLPPTLPRSVHFDAVLIDGFCSLFTIHWEMRDKPLHQKNSAWHGIIHAKDKVASKFVWTKNDTHEKDLILMNQKQIKREWLPNVFRVGYAELLAFYSLSNQPIVRIAK